jgi:hypothetical protein
VNRKNCLLSIAGAVCLTLLLVGCGSQEVTVAVSQAELKAIQSMPQDVVFFTSASNPISSLKGLQDDEIAMWGGELVDSVQKLLALSGRADTPVGLRVVGAGDDNAKFNKNSHLRLFITHETYAKSITDGGGVRIKFVGGK